MSPDLAELRALWEAAGDGPWAYSQDGMGALCYLRAAKGTYPVVSDIVGTIPLSENAALIVAMHAALPGLLTAVELLRDVEWAAGRLWRQTQADTFEHVLIERIEALLGVPGSLVEPTPEET